MSRRADPSHFPQQLMLATKFLDRAIRMFFAGDDPHFVLAIANPGHVLLHEIAEQTLPTGNVASWVTKRLVDEGVVSEATKVGDVVTALRRDANAIKHASVSPGVSLESVLATLNVACVDAVGLSVATPVQLKFLTWRLARDAGQPKGIKAYAENIFPGLGVLNFADALAVGHAALDDKALTARMVELSPLLSSA